VVSPWSSRPPPRSWFATAPARPAPDAPPALGAGPAKIRTTGDGSPGIDVDAGHRLIV
jgi:hypothetical protein